MENKFKKSISEDFKGFPERLINGNDIKQNGFNYLMRNEYPSKDNQIYFYNLDDKNNTGTHWCLIILQKPYMFYIDPMGTNLNGYPPEELRNYGKQYGYSKIYANEMQIQPVLSNFCGHICLYLAFMFQKILGQINEKMFDYVIHNQFKDYGHIDNVKKIYEWSQANNLL